MLWLSGMKRRDLLLLLPPGAVLAASLVMSRLLGSNILAALPVAAFVGTASFVLGYLFSEDWRRLILAQLSRARVILGRLIKRAKPISPANTNAHK
jgi:hypothetical protein